MNEMELQTDLVHIRQAFTQEEMETQTHFDLQTSETQTPVKDFTS